MRSEVTQGVCKHVGSLHFPAARDRLWNHRVSEAPPNIRKWGP